FSAPALCVQGRFEQQSIQGVRRPRWWVVDRGQPRDCVRQRRLAALGLPIGRPFVVPEHERGSRWVGVGGASGGEYFGLGSLSRDGERGEVLRKGTGSTDQPDRFDIRRWQRRFLARRPDLACPLA